MTKKNKIDILLITDNGLDTVGGEQESTKIIINGIKSNYSLGVIQPGTINNPVSNVHYYPLTVETRIKHLIKNPLSFLNYLWKVKKIINKEKPRIIHTQAQVSFFIVGLLLKFKLINNSFEFIHTERGLYIKYKKIFKLIFQFFMKNLDVLVTTTKFNMNNWKAAIKFKQINYEVIENTAGEIFEKYDQNKEIKKDKLVIGFAGRYSDQKDWPLAIEIIEKLNKILGKEFKVNMAVGCLDENSKIMTENMFSKLKKKLKGRFEGEINIKLSEMDDFYYKNDIFIMTSKHNSESFGRTLVEAMSRKTVVLSTDAGGPVEVLGNKANICDNAEEFVERILLYYYHNDKMEKEKHSNLNRVKAKYSLKNNIKKHLNLYKNYVK